MVVVGTDDIGFAEFAFLEYQVDGGVVVVDVDPVADLLAGAIELGGAAFQNLGNLARDELFDVLIRAVVV